MVYFPVFAELRLENICRVDSGWNISEDTLVEVVHSFWESEEELPQQKLLLAAEKAYGNSSVGSQSRVKSFNTLALRIRREGYLCILNSTDSEFVNAPPYSFLPRLHDKRGVMTVDDGHHRIAVLRSLGIKVFPAVIVRKEVRTMTPEEVIGQYTKLSESFTRELPAFLTSGAWKDYQATKDYLLWNTKSTT